MRKYEIAIKERDHAWDMVRAARKELHSVLAAVRSVYELSDYADNYVPPIVRFSTTGTGYSRTDQMGYMDSGLERLKVDLLAAADSTKASEALARLKKIDTAEGLAKAVADSIRRAAKTGNDQKG